MRHTKLPLPPKTTAGKGFSGSQVMVFISIAVILTILATVFIIRYFLFPPPFTPVVLKKNEQHQLEEKLSFLETGQWGQQKVPTSTDRNHSLTPERYTEDDLSREVKFTEREINSLIAHNTDLATKLAIDLSEDMVSLKLLIPMDPDFPMLGGKTLRVRTGAELAYREGRPIVKLRGVSVMGVPIPNAWLGGIKNIDLVQEFGETEGFWKSFSDGVESIRVTDGFLTFRLKP